MKFVVPVVLVLTSISLIPALPRNFKNDNRIVGGYDDVIENVPWQISLHRNGGHHCGGSILNQNTILTAAHCVDTITTPSSYTVRAGSTNRASGGQLLQVTSIHIHPDYTRQNLFNDIAVLKLSSNLLYGDGVQPILLPPTDLDVPAPTPVQLSGWGTLVYQGSSTNILQTVVKPIVSMDECQEAYGVEDVDPAIQICSGEEGRDACQGDSGGGLIYRNQVIGIVSWGNGCAWARYPSVYTRVASFLDFIRSFM